MVLPSPRVPGHLHQQQSLSLPCSSRSKERTPLWAAASLDPKNLGQLCRSLGGGGTVDWPQSLAFSLRTSACPASFLDQLASQQGTLSGRLGSLAVLWRGARTGGTVMAPRSATHSSLPVPSAHSGFSFYKYEMVEDMNSPRQVATRLL